MQIKFLFIDKADGRKVEYRSVSEFLSGLFDGKGSPTDVFVLNDRLRAAIGSIVIMLVGFDFRRPLRLRKFLTMTGFTTAVVYVYGDERNKPQAVLYDGLQDRAHDSDVDLESRAYGDGADKLWAQWWAYTIESKNETDATPG